MNANRTINSEPYQKSNHTEYFLSGIHHGGIARDAAMVYLITGDTKYADKSRDIILSWAAANEKKPTRIDARFNGKGDIIGSPAGLVIGRVITSFCYAYSLVYSHLSEEDKIRIEDWLASLVPKIKQSQSHWIENNYFKGQLYNNHLSAQTMGLAAIGYTLGDKELIKYAVDDPDNPRNIIEMINGAVMMPGDTPFRRDPDQNPITEAGEIYDRYRSRKGSGLSYGHLHLALMTQIAEMVYNNNGFDLFKYTGPDGENLERAFEFYADLYITGSSTAKGDYYANETVKMHRIFLYEIAAKRYPGNKKILEVVQYTDRTVGFDREVFGSSALLTHGFSPWQRIR